VVLAAIPPLRAMTARTSIRAVDAVNATRLQKPLAGSRQSSVTTDSAPVRGMLDQFFIDQPRVGQFEVVRLGAEVLIAVELWPENRAACDRAAIADSSEGCEIERRCGRFLRGISAFGRAQKRTSW